MSLVDTAPAPAHAGGSVAAAQAAMQAIEMELNQLVLGKEHIVRGLLLALATKQHLCILGEPGAAKSWLINALLRRLAMPQFARQVSEMTAPERLVGPLDLDALNGSPARLRYEVDGYLPTAWIAFIDEVFRASTLLDDLLSMTDEQRVFDNDRERQPVPLLSLFSASNFLSDDPRQEAIWDRFLLRFVTDPLDDEGLFQMLRGRADRTADTVPVTRLRGVDLLAFQEAVREVEVGDTILRRLVQIRRQLRQEGYRISDRRVGWSLTVAQAAALLEGRTAVHLSDLRYLTACVWMDPTHIRKIELIVLQHVSPAAAEAARLTDLAVEAVGRWEAALRQANDADARIDITTNASNDLKSTIRRLGELRQRAAAEGEPEREITRYLTQVQGYQNTMRQVLLPQ